MEPYGLLFYLGPILVGPPAALLLVGVLIAVLLPKLRPLALQGALCGVVGHLMAFVSLFSLDAHHTVLYVGLPVGFIVGVVVGALGLGLKALFLAAN